MQRTFRINWKMSHHVVNGLFLLFFIITVNNLSIGESTEDGDKSNTINITATENKKSWFCPEGWIPYSNDHTITCLSVQKEAKTFEDSKSHCQSLGAQGLVVFPNDEQKEKFVKGLIHSTDRDHWIGLSKDRGYNLEFFWHTTYNKFDHVPRQFKSYENYKSQCVYISSFNYQLEMDECETEYSYICEKKVSCKPGYFGDKCVRECHCAGETCNSDSDYGADDIICKWGCQKNWMGIACDTERHDPDVKYFCINSQEAIGQHALIHIFTKGIKYRAIYSSNYNKTADDTRGSFYYGYNPCNRTILADNDHTIIQIPVNPQTISLMAAGRCPGEQLEESVFSWTLVIKENTGILLDHDLVANLKCDFTNADKLSDSHQYSLEGEPKQANRVIISPEYIQEDVSLDIINAFTGEQVTEGLFSTAVSLQITYGLRNDSFLKSVFPYNCTAYSLDRKYVKPLLDENGCQVNDSPVLPFRATNGSKLTTPWFSLFAFEGEQSVSFQCLFELCFGSICETGCRTHKTRFVRDTRDRTEEVQHSTTRTIRVLPSISAQTNEGDNSNSGYQRGPAPAGSGYEVGPFVYLNPVTCTFFLLILLVFLCMYIAFLRTLRKSVYDIRKEIEIKRSRDKFLHCGCVQQKDRDFIQQ